MSFVQHVSVIFLVLVVERVTAYNTLNLDRTWIRNFLLSVLLKSGLVRGMAIWEAGLIREELLYTDLFRLTIYFLKKNNMFTK
jgi:hypothetical protein